MNTGKVYVWASRIFLANLALLLVRSVRDAGVAVAEGTTRGAAGALADKMGGGG